MHRFHLPPELCRGESLRLDGREAHHAVQVLRLQRDKMVTVLDGAGVELTCAVESVSKHAVSLRVVKKNIAPHPASRITLFVAIPKGKIIEDIIQKAVELGAHRIVPLLTERVVTQLNADGAEQKREKWQQVAIEAIKQCGTPWLPIVSAPAALINVLKAGTLPEFSIVGSLQTERRHPQTWLEEFQQKHGRKPATAGIWIGPEGDFTRAELEAIEAAGARPVTLGDLTLRVETAAIYCLSVLRYEL